MTLKKLYFRSHRLSEGKEKEEIQKFVDLVHKCGMKNLM